MIRFSTLDDQNQTTVTVGSGNSAHDYIRSEYRDFKPGEMGSECISFARDR